MITALILLFGSYMLYQISVTLYDLLLEIRSISNYLQDEDDDDDQIIVP